MNKQYCNKVIGVFSIRYSNFYSQYETLDEFVHNCFKRLNTNGHNLLFTKVSFNANYIYINYKYEFLKTYDIPSINILVECIRSQLIDIKYIIDVCYSMEYDPNIQKNIFKSEITLTKEKAFKKEITITEGNKRTIFLVKEIL